MFVIGLREGLAGLPHATIFICGSQKPDGHHAAQLSHE